MLHVHHTASWTLVPPSRKRETVIVPFNPTRWRYQCLEYNVGVYQKQELFLEFNVCGSQRQEPKGPT